jgi:hypothetical protein
VKVSFGIESYQHRSRPLASQRMINCYIEAAPTQAKTFAAIVENYGIAPHLTVGAGFTRGGAEINDVLYTVVGEVLYLIPPTGAPVPLGSIPGANYVQMAGDETHVMLVTNHLGYVWDGTAVTQITDEDFPGAEWVVVLDGYFIVGVPSSGRFAISGNRDPLVWDALDFATGEAYPDDNVGAVADHGELILFGKRSGQAFDNTGAADFPFEAIKSGKMEVGLMSRHGLAKIDNTIYFLGHDGLVYKLQGYKPERISTHWVEQIIEDWPDKTCFGMTFVEGGHKMFALSSDTGTVVFDIATGKWHERMSLGFARWRPLFILRAHDRWYVGDFYTNRIGILDPHTFTEWSDVLRCSATSSAISDGNKRIRNRRLELIFESGVGLNTGQGSDPKIMLDWSNDGGRTWSGEHWRPLGKIGEFLVRALWNRIGKPRDRVYRYTVTDPVRRTLISAELNAEQGAN